jgi:sn-glycerol 3-phosphate transport system permease protein
MTTLEQTPSALVVPSNTSKGFLRRILPERWYVHLILILSVVIIGFPMFYAVLVSTQSNGQVFSYQFTPARILWKTLMLC